MIGWKTLAGPDEEPISIEEARAHIEAQPYATGDSDSDDLVDGAASAVDAADDAMIQGWIVAAREFCEDFLGLSLALRSIEAALDSFPNEDDDGTTAIELPMGPVQQIIQITYSGDGSTGGSATDGGVLSEERYVLDDYRMPNRLIPTGAWPTVSGTNAVKIRYLAGYGEDTDFGGVPLPGVIRAAMLLILGHLYQHREENTDDALTSLPLGVESLLRPRRVRMGFA